MRHQQKAVSIRSRDGWSREAKTWLSSRNVAGGTMSERTDRKTTAARKAGIVELKIAANSHRLKYFLSSTITPTDTMSWNILKVLSYVEDP